MCESFALQYGCNFLSLMPTNLYGNNDNFDLHTSHVLPALLRKIHLAKLLSQGRYKEIIQDLNLENDAIESYLKQYGITPQSVEIWGSGRPKREFLHVQDMAEACVFVMQNLDFKDMTTHKQEIRNTHINIGYGSDISIAELAKLICEVIGFDGELIFNTSKPDGTYQKLMDSRRINALGWRPKITLKSGIESVYKHYINRTKG